MTSNDYIFDDASGNEQSGGYSHQQHMTFTIQIVYIYYKMLETSVHVKYITVGGNELVHASF